MGREVEFRAWNKRLEKMYSVYGLDFDSDLVYCRSESGSTHTFGMIDVYLMQYIGINDIKGNKIFEDDLIGDYKKETVHQITYYDCRFTAMRHGNSCTLYSSWIEEFQKVVIGNIHEGAPNA